MPTTVYHELDIRLLTKGTADYQTFFFKHNTFGGANFKTSHEAIRADVVTFKSTTRQGPISRILIRDLTDIETHTIIAKTRARIRHIETGETYYLELEVGRGAEAYGVTSAFMISALDTALTYQTKTYSYDVDEISTRPNPDYVPS